MTLELLSNRSDAGEITCRCLVMSDEINIAVIMIPPPKIAESEGVSPVAKKTQNGLRTGSMVAIKIACTAFTRFIP